MRPKNFVEAKFESESQAKPGMVLEYALHKARTNKR